MSIEKHVYFIKPVGMDGPIKIGCSIRPVTRLRDVEIWSPLKLEILAHAPGEHRQEKALHYLFADYRLHGEWFGVSDGLSAVIAHVAATGELPCLETLRQAMPPKPRKGRLPRRNPAAANAKMLLSSRIGRAERGAHGYFRFERRPEEIKAIMSGYQGWASPLPSAAELAVLERYIAHLGTLPRAETGFAAWKLWDAAREARAQAVAA